jgi:hypothetical protein
MKIVFILISVLNAYYINKFFCNSKGVHLAACDVIFLLVEDFVCEFDSVAVDPVFA